MKRKAIAILLSLFTLGAWAQTSVSDFDDTKTYTLKTARGYMPKTTTSSIYSVTNVNDAGHFRITYTNGSYYIYNISLRQYLAANAPSGSAYVSEPDGTFRIYPASDVGGSADKWIIHSNENDKWLMFGGSNQYLNNQNWKTPDAGDQWTIEECTWLAVSQSSAETRTDQYAQKVTINNVVVAGGESGFSSHPGWHVVTDIVEVVQGENFTLGWTSGVTNTRATIYLDKNANYEFSDDECLGTLGSFRSGNSGLNNKTISISTDGLPLNTETVLRLRFDGSWIHPESANTSSGAYKPEWFTPSASAHDFDSPSTATYAFLPEAGSTRVVYDIHLKVVEPLRIEDAVLNIGGLEFDGQIDNRGNATLTTYRSGLTGNVTLTHTATANGEEYTVADLTPVFEVLKTVSTATTVTIASDVTSLGEAYPAYVAKRSAGYENPQPVIDGNYSKAEYRWDLNPVISGNCWNLNAKIRFGTKQINQWGICALASGTNPTSNNYTGGFQFYQNARTNGTKGLTFLKDNGTAQSLMSNGAVVYLENCEATLQLKYRNGTLRVVILSDSGISIDQTFTTTITSISNLCGLFGGDSEILGLTYNFINEESGNNGSETTWLNNQYISLAPTPEGYTGRYNVDENGSLWGSSKKQQLQRVPSAAQLAANGNRFTVPTSMLAISPDAFVNNPTAKASVGLKHYLMIDDILPLDRTSLMINMAENNASALASLSGTTFPEVIATRTAAGASSWDAIMLPFDWTATGIKEASSITVNGNKVKLSFADAAGTLAAGKTYFIEPGQHIDDELVFANKTIASTVQPQTVSSGTVSVTITGSYDARTATAGDYALDGTFFSHATGTIPADKPVLTVAGATPVYISIEGEDDPDNTPDNLPDFSTLPEAVIPVAGKTYYIAAQCLADNVWTERFTYLDTALQSKESPDNSCQWQCQENGTGITLYNPTKDRHMLTWGFSSNAVNTTVAAADMELVTGKHFVTINTAGTYVFAKQDGTAMTNLGTNANAVASYQPDGSGTHDEGTALYTPYFKFYDVDTYGQVIDQQVYYLIQFTGADLCLTDMGADNEAKAYRRLDAIDGQQWLMVGTWQSFKLYSKDGHYLYLDGTTYKTSVTDGGTDAYKFSLVANGDNWEIHCKAAASGQNLSQNGGATVGTTLTSGTSNCVLRFVSPKELTAPTFSAGITDANYQRIQFTDGEKYLADKGDDHIVADTYAEREATQHWALVGTWYDFQLYNRDGQYAGYSDGHFTATTNGDVHFCLASKDGNGIEIQRINSTSSMGQNGTEETFGNAGNYVTFSDAELDFKSQAILVRDTYKGLPEAICGNGYVGNYNAADYITDLEAAINANNLEAMTTLLNDIGPANEFSNDKLYSIRNYKNTSHYVYGYESNAWSSGKANGGFTSAYADDNVNYQWAFYQIGDDYVMYNVAERGALNSTNGAIKQNNWEIKKTYHAYSELTSVVVPNTTPYIWNIYDPEKTNNDKQHYLHENIDSYARGLTNWQKDADASKWYIREIGDITPQVAKERRIFLKQYQGIQVVADPADAGTVAVAGYESVTDGKYTVANSNLTLTATSIENNIFVGWYRGEDLLSTNKECTVTPDADDIVYTARFSTIAEFFSTVANPKWFLIQFSKALMCMTDMGSGSNMQVTVRQDWEDDQRWQLIGDQDSYKLRSKSGNYVRWNGSRYATTNDESVAASFSLVVAQNGYEMHRTGAADDKNMNQNGAVHNGTELAEWNANDNNNKFEIVAPTDILPPTFSTLAATPAFYQIKFKAGGACLKDMGVNAALKTAADKRNDYAQSWMLIGTDDGFKLRSANGHYAGFADSKFKAVNAASAVNFRLVTDGVDFELQRIVDSGLNTMNQNGGTGADRELHEYEMGNANNMLSFVAAEVASLTGIRVVVNGEAGVVGTVSVGDDTPEQDGVYTVHGAFTIVATPNAENKYDFVKWTQKNVNNIETDLKIGSTSLVVPQGNNMTYTAYFKIRETWVETPQGQDTRIDQYAKSVSIDGDQVIPAKGAPYTSHPGWYVGESKLTEVKPGQQITLSWASNDGDDRNVGLKNTRATIYIDKDRDYFFSSDECLGTVGEFSVNTNTTSSFTFTIPEDIKMGTETVIRLRFDGAWVTDQTWNPTGVANAFLPDADATRVVYDIHILVGGDLNLNQNKTSNNEKLEQSNGQDVGCIVIADRVLKTNWNTLTLPFSISSSDTEWNTYFAEVRELVDITNTTNMVTLQFSAPRTSIEAGKPYIVKGKNTDVIVVNDKTIDNTMQDITVSNRDYKVTMKGNYDPLVISNGEYFISDKNGGVSKFYWADSKVSVKGFRAYIVLKNADGTPVKRVREMHIDSMTEDGIVTIDARPEAEAVYDLMGNRMTAPLDRLPQGVYIVNGRKVINQ